MSAAGEAMRSRRAGSAGSSGPSGSSGSAGHLPVMAEELVSALRVRPGGVYIDGTFGGGGHSRAILQAAEGCFVIALDRDPAARPRAERLAADFAGRFRFVPARFSQLGQASEGKVDGVALDLGLSSFQLDDPERGFSHTLEGPLSMRMDAEGAEGAEDPSAPVSAAGLLAALDSEALAEILRVEGEEPRAAAIARAIVRAREEAPLHTTGDLRRAVCAAGGAQGPLLHKRLARVFQALRRHINDEAAELERALLAAAEALAEGGRCVVISFHSLEDRVVKRAFAAPDAPDAHAATTGHRVGTPFLPAGGLQRPSEGELARNSRARSARLRAGERTAAPAPAAPWWREAA